MPFLRFTRDRRGYEVTYVVHTFRRRGKSRSRILYWFRTPPNVKVGRAALDEEAIRTIEEAHPDLPFDWAKMLKLQSAAVAQTAEREVTRGRAVRSGGSRHRKRPATGAEPAARGGVDENAGKAVSTEAPTGGETQAAAPQIGAEDLERLRARYAEILTRISDRVTDPARRAELRELAGGLNPDAWVTAEDVRQGLANFENGFTAIGAKIGRRRRRSRRGGARRTGRRRAGAAPRTAALAGKPPPEVREPEPEAGE
jgi:hypothetical protein